jgi:plasmid maintenance system killer protein
MTGPAAPDGNGHPANGLDDIVHQRVRLGILAIAHEARRVEFSYLRTNLELSAGNLSQHLGVLENARLITIEKATPASAPAPGSLAMLDAAETLADLLVPPGNRLGKPTGDRAGQHSIRVNRQWRICFFWSDA